MASTFSIALYQQKDGHELSWITLGLGPRTLEKRGRNPLKIQRALVDELKGIVTKLGPTELEQLQMARGIRLERVRLELTQKGTKRRKISGVFPLVLEPRWASAEKKIVIAYHPRRQDEWFAANDQEPLEEQAALLFQRTWSEIPDDLIELLLARGKDAIKTISFTAAPKTLLDQLPDLKGGIWQDLVIDPARSGQDKKPGASGLEALPNLGTNQSWSAIEGGGPLLGLPRSPYREQLQLLLCGEQKRPVIVVGPPGSGKSTIIQRWVHDLLEADGYESHRNLDRIHDVWLLSGKRIIAGMSYIGDWEQRCIQILEDARKKKMILWIEDLFAFGRIGQSRQSDRNLAEFFRGPLARGEVTMIGECTPEQLQRLEDDAPSFAALFTRIHVQATTPAETLRMVTHAARTIEQAHPVIFDPFAFRSIIELGGALFPSAAFPGKAIDLLRELATAAAEERGSDRAGDGAGAGAGAKAGANAGPKETTIDPARVIAHLSQKTGLGRVLDKDRAIDESALEEELSQRVMGQPAAIEAARDLILRIRAGLTDPGRPYGVYLFTGPTGTGKTELAKAIAAYLYGGSSRLLRFDMSEYGSPDAVSRLIGDRFQPEGLLTRQVQEQPFCVVLLDEIEKAHPLLSNLLLQLFDEGRLTDARGTTADFRHTVIIMTSNLGARERPAIGFEGEPDAILFDVMQAVREFFAPELFNRIDRIVPFRPLSKEVALRIADRELGSFVRRRGLTERSIFVSTTRAVLERTVKEAFDPRDGARPVQRYIEERIGSLLTSWIVEGKERSMQILRVFERGGKFGVAADHLTEAEPSTEPLLLEPMLALPPDELKKHLPVALDFVRRLAESPEVGRLAGTIRERLVEHNLGRREHDDLLYNLESIRQHLGDLGERIELLLESQVKDDPELLEVTQFGWSFGGTDEPHRHRRFDRRMMRPSVPPLIKDLMLSCLGEVHFLRRALLLASDPEQHAVFVELLRIGLSEQRDRPDGADPSASGSASGSVSGSVSGSARGGLIEALAEAYLADPGKNQRRRTRELDSHAIRYRDGRVAHGGRDQSFSTGGIIHGVFKLVGLCVYDLFAGEDGCHIGRAEAGGSELVRVRVWPAPPGIKARSILTEYQALRRRYEEGLENPAESLVPNPDALLPAARAYRYPWSAPSWAGAAETVEVDDYRLGYSTSARVRSLSELIFKLWLLRMSRES